MRWTIEDTPERAQFRNEFRAWLHDNLPTGWMDAIDSGDDEVFTRARKDWNLWEWNARIGASGYGAPLWPREYGGLGGEVWMQMVVREELARYRLPLFGLNILGIGLAGPTLIKHGTPEQKERYLRKILTGEEIWCQLFSEPGAGSDLAGVGTRAVRANGEWILNGQKVWTSIAQWAHYGMLLARSDPEVPKHDGLTYFILDMKAPGIDIRPLRQLTGASEFNEVYMTDVRIPDEHRVGTEGDGWRVSRTTLMNERVTLSGLSIDSTSFMGGARRDPWKAFVDAVPHRDGVTMQEIARLYVEKEVKEITSFRATAARLRGETPGPEGAVGKVYNAEYNQRRTAFAVNAAGLAGVAWKDGDQEAENRAHAFLRARANTIEGGTSEVLRNQIGERILGLPRDVDADKGVPWKDIRRS